MHARTHTPVVTGAHAPELTQHMCCDFYIAQHTIIAQPSKFNHEYEPWFFCGRFLAEKSINIATYARANAYARCHMRPCARTHAVHVL